jgi:hypothetical protein
LSSFAFLFFLKPNLNGKLSNFYRLAVPVAVTIAAPVAVPTTPVLKKDKPQEVIEAKSTLKSSISTNSMLTFEEEDGG